MSTINQPQATKITDVLEDIYTLSELNNYIRMLNNIKPYIFKHGEDMAKKLQSELPPKLASFVANYAQTSNFNLQDQVEIQRLLQQIIYILHRVAVVEITVPAALTSRQIEKVCKWWRATTGRAIVIDVKVDLDLIAGIRIGYEGKYTDYSLSTWLQDKGKIYLDKVKVE